MTSNAIKISVHSLAAFAALSLLASGCGSHNSIIGKWSGTTTIPGRPGMKTAIEFKSNGTSTVNLVLPAGSATEMTTYTETENTFTITPVSATLGGQTKVVAGAVPEAYSYVLEADKLTLTQKGGARITLTRTG